LILPSIFPDAVFAAGRAAGFFADFFTLFFATGFAVRVDFVLVLVAKAALLES
jgi:hypothetical protein